jgi:hypothetical protein
MNRRPEEECFAVSTNPDEREDWITNVVDSLPLQDVASVCDISINCHLKAAETSFP